ncbi:hypothetical protein LTS08_003603 [Lithohypha guttulata]|nr:hypothetical protein LTS08_003603 [Lithohypha guttulata]
MQNDPSEPCNAANPCSRCTTKNVNCTYSDVEDQRVRGSTKRRHEQNENQNRIFQDVIQTIRDVDDPDLAQIIALIRSNAPIEEVRVSITQMLQEATTNKRQITPDLERVRDGIERESGFVPAVTSSIPGPSYTRSNIPPQHYSPTTPSENTHVTPPRSQHFADYLAQDLQPSYTPEETLRQTDKRKSGSLAALKISRLIDTPLVTVSAWPWTTATDDDTLVSHLISMWLTWDKPMFDFIERDLFIRDMQTGHHDVTYCSQFLVNSLLAVACPYSDFPEARSSHGRTSELMRSFLNDAKEHLSNDTSISITKAQGLGLLFIAHSVLGQDALAVEIFQQADDTCRALESQLTASSGAGVSKVDSTFRKALNKTRWGLFNLSTLVINALLVPAKMYPPLELPPESTGVAVTWSPYPLSVVPHFHFMDELFAQQSRLSLIVLDISLLTTTKNRLVPLEAAEIFLLHDRLPEWRNSMPAFLLPHSEASAPVLTLHGYYLTVVMSLDAIVRSQGIEMSADQTAQLNEENTQAALGISVLCDTHTKRYGNAHMAEYWMQPMIRALYILVTSTQSDQYNKQMVSLAIFARSMSRRWPLALASFVALNSSVHELGKRFPPETDKLFEDLTVREWKERGPLVINSKYPVVGDHE